jgi:two-component system LytT family response regulator
MERLERGVAKLHETALGALDMRTRSIGRVQRQIFVSEGERCWIIYIEDIQLMESEGNYTRLYFANGSPLVYRSLRAIEDRLDPTLFFRANRLQMINLRFVEKVEKEANSYLNVTLSNKRRVEISRRQSAKLRKWFSF